MTALFSLLAVQICLGAFDSLWNHELTERLRERRSARRELALHGARELLYAVMFMSLAWYEWHGVWAWILGTLLIIEIAITLADFVIEDRTRKLPATERVVHTLLAINFGVLLAVLLPTWMTWVGQVTALAPVHHGAWSWFLTLSAAGVTLFSIRNFSAAARFAIPPRWRRFPLRAGIKKSRRTLLVTGATGFIGRHLCRRIIESGDRLIVLSRDYDRAWDIYGPHARIVTSLEQIEGETRIDFIVNLAGAPILGRPWTLRRRRELMRCRSSVTNAIVDMIARLDRKPRALISMSAIGYYGVRGDEEITEADRGRPIFQSHLCQIWELAAQRAQQYGVRVCRLRSGLVLGADGGALPKLLRPLKLRTRIVLGSGGQWVSWIHIDDLLRMMELCIERSDLCGAFNACAPVPLRQADFAQLSAAHFCKTLPLRVPGGLLRCVMGEMSQLLVDGQRVLPARALQAGFAFRHPTLNQALEALFPHRESPEAQPAQILYDPNCPVCDAEMSRYCRDARAAGLSWRFENVTERAEVMAQYRIDATAARQRVYVIDSRGEISSGIEALAKIWARLPSWRLLARCVRMPVLRVIAAGAYDLVIAPTIWRWSMRRTAGAARDARAAARS
jgi:uncharacterized protein (TIGR01777 family)